MSDPSLDAESAAARLLGLDPPGVIAKDPPAPAAPVPAPAPAPAAVEVLPLDGQDPTQFVLERLESFPGHGKPHQEMIKGLRASVCAQFTPASGRLYTVTDPNDTILNAWVNRKRKVYICVRDAEGNLTKGYSVPAPQAADALRLEIARQKP